jgi:hypothetical protein
VNSFWEQIEPHIVNAVAILLPLIVGVAAGWLRHQARVFVEGVVRKVEDHASSRPAPMSGAAKRELALGLIHQERPQMSEERASQLIEAVLPKVRAEAAERLSNPDLPPKTPRSG